MLTTDELMSMKEEIDDAKIKVSELNGQLKYLKEQLDTQFGCKTVEEAEKLIKEKDVEIQKLNKQLEEGCAELEEQYGIM
jgi:chromosome segregation ATPase